MEASAPAGNDIDPQMQQIDEIKCAAMIETIDWSGNGRFMFQEVNKNNAPTHKITIGYTKQRLQIGAGWQIIVNDSDRHNVISAVNKDNDYLYIEILTELLGDKDVYANYV